MNPDQDLLQQLHDIHLPAALGRWPLAPGWVALLGIMLLLLIVGVVWGWRWVRRGKVKREALRVLALYEKTYYAEMNTQTSSAALNELLKRVALAYFPREQVAQLYGKEWLVFLQETSKKLDFLTEGEAFLYAPYQLNQARDLRPLFHLVRSWIAQRERPCLS